MALITSSSQQTLSPGAAAPEFDSLPGVDGKLYSLNSFETASILVLSFTCNHCPYAVAYEERFNNLAKKYQPQSVAFVAINSNDENDYPQDSFENMQIRARERGFVFPYIQDKSQSVARSYGAVCTPHIFVFDQKRILAYEGRIDDNWREPDLVTSHELRDVLDAMLAGQDLPPKGGNPIGCSIKWR